MAYATPSDRRMVVTVKYHFLKDLNTYNIYLYISSYFSDLVLNPLAWLPVTYVENWKEAVQSDSFHALPAEEKKSLHLRRDGGKFVKKNTYSFVVNKKWQQM